VTSTESTPTFAHEDSLPRVPLPTLEESCTRFLEWCAPLLTDDQRAVTEKAVAEFLRAGGPAHTLHAALREYDSTEGVRSWLDRFWPSRYLGRRDRIALNANFFFLFQPSELGQRARAARIIASTVDYKLRLDAEAIPPVMQRGRPLSMDQVKYLFSTTRIPGTTQDTVRAPYSDAEPGPSTARHIVVLSRGHLYRLDVVDPDGRPVSVANLEQGLADVLAATETRAEFPVGHLTTKARAEWAESRAALLRLPGNAEALDTVETALFCVALDDHTPSDTKDACDHLLHGDSGTRWFDKSVSFVVFADGTAGINIEHCGLDGTTVLSFVDTVLTTEVDERESTGTPALAPIEFTLDDALRKDVSSAATAFADYAAATASRLVSFDDIGSTRIKQLNISPDAFMQLAYQLAHKRAKGFLGATYESIATRQYQAGRTEAMRVVTPEIVRFVDVMENPDADVDDRVAAVRAAAEKHVARAKECQAGKAPEQHLWELQLVAARQPELGVDPDLPLYSTPGWTVMRDDYLSTSSAPSENIQYFGFGSTSSHCIGVAYVLLPDRVNIYLSTPEAVAAEMATFAEQLTTAVYELEDLLDPQL
jgi:carnitine O-acetyltransferase